MPIYEYKCEKCENVYEELVTGDRDRKIPCPSCGSLETGKVMSRLGGIAAVPVPAPWPGLADVRECVRPETRILTDKQRTKPGFFKMGVLCQSLLYFKFLHYQEAEAIGK
jgi:putative FmdB family regulatory protein